MNGFLAFLRRVGTADLKKDSRRTDTPEGHFNNFWKDNLSPHDQHKLRIEDIVGMRMRSNRKYTIKLVRMHVMVVSGVCVTSVKLSVH